MTALLFATLFISILGLVSVLYAFQDAWEDYTLAAKKNGWVLLSARSILRSQVIRIIQGGLLTAAVILGIRYPEEIRPGYVTVMLRVAIITVILLISFNAVMDVLSRRQILKHIPTEPTPTEAE